MTPFEVAQASFWLTLLNAGVAIVMYAVIVFSLLRIADKISGANFGESFQKVTELPLALAIYLGLRYFVLGIGSAMILAASFMYA